MKQIITRLLLITTVFPTTSPQAQDFGNFEYRNVGPSRGGRVTAVAGTVAAPSVNTISPPTAWTRLASM